MLVLIPVLVGAGLPTAVLIAVTGSKRRRLQDDDDGPRDSDGGSGRRSDGPRPNRPHGDQPQPSDSPEWWPQFERDFAAYVGASQRRHEAPSHNATAGVTLAGLKPAPA
jgi:hypothetical protein